MKSRRQCLFHNPRRPRLAAAVALAAVLASALPDSDAFGAVRISEFCADNAGVLLTHDGMPADWIELHNNADNAVDLGGWHLTDKASAPTKWRFPDGTRIDLQHASLSTNRRGFF